jgi:hypothetical protein
MVLDKPIRSLLATGLFATASMALSGWNWEHHHVFPPMVTAVLQVKCQRDPTAAHVEMACMFFLRVSLACCHSGVVCFCAWGFEGAKKHTINSV